MEITPDKQNKSNIWLIVLGTAVTTVVVVMLALYSFGLLGNSSSEMPMAHTEGMVHTEGMNHDMEMSGRRAEVAELGRQVMPFDLERTTHVFDKQDFGGVQQVLSDDSDPEQIALIQTHLQEEFASFQ
ncbi:MAG: hypothetical protein KDE51_28060 [Anaerolineales bacterium]|nr:hypothetical protein [Anaerolineales bacterium]